ncbi:MAG TPA: AsmA family protein, partial [Ignavibacteriaceae bacterium]
MIFRKKVKVRKPLFRRIINIFIYSTLVLIFLLLLIFGFTQTKTFREWLRETVIQEVNLATNGKLSFERIDGTILTSLILSNTIYTLAGDTLLNAEKIELRTSPLKLVFKIIYLRKLEISNAKIALIRDNDGELNISKLTKPSDEEPEPEDTSSSQFTFKFEAADLTLNNVDFLIQSENKKYSKEYYDHPDFDDFRLKNINLNLYGFADIANEEYILKIKHLSVEPNLNNFLLNDFS